MKNSIQREMTIVIDKYLPPSDRYRTWLIRYIIIKEYYEKYWKKIKGKKGRKWALDRRGGRGFKNEA